MMDHDDPATDQPPAPGEHWMHCAVHNGPAFEPGPCDCGVAEELAYERHSDPAAFQGAVETMGGDLTAWLIDRIKNLRTTWAQMPEAEQATLIGSARLAVEDTVKTVVRMIAADGRPVIPATLDQITVKDGIKGVLKMRKDDPLRHALLEAQGKSVMLIVAEADRFLGGADPEPDPDQPGLTAGDDDGPVFDNTDMGRAA